MKKYFLSLILLSTLSSITPLKCEEPSDTISAVFFTVAGVSLGAAVIIALLLKAVEKSV